MVEDISVEEFVALLNKGGIVPIDVRSPGEFEEGTIPGSLNIPLFDNEERREIGIAYKQESVDAAKDRGLEIVSAKLPQFIRELQSIPGRKAVFCWRGGMRSKTSATLLSIVAGRVYRVKGGIREYRRWVVDTLQSWNFTQQAIVINGYTGTGKTAILRMLHEKGYPVLDLEALAGHRGSIFGAVGMEPNNQRTFDSLLVHELIRLKDTPYLLMEGESRRIGKAIMPDFLVEAKERAVQLYLEMPVKERVRNILSDYAPEQYKAECLEAFRRIERKIHTPVAARIRKAMEEDRFAEAVQLLLEYYYDPKYEYTIGEYAAELVTLQADNVKEAAEKIEVYLKKWTKKAERAKHV
ncbi:tRNA 2-selenouridine(34) synthase MnmH [Paenibacillus thermotolerans]|uniref:tRNA 2-selenouridine(34) synthase MnmH n=1 Tax=Paenibacillus thermotolerans TaxID=3027807 RepID=UPI002367FEE0|nr:MULTISPECIES: tRNA 2-selenouridine(34) synthase MnmH [unclassified Paenibacillus]